ncbi:hypothetical protein GCM10027168_66360 [Streptomyces capparidis]
MDAMTTAGPRWALGRRGATPWARAAVVVLFVVLAVLVHHQSPAGAVPASPVSAMAGMPDMAHGASMTAVSSHGALHGAAAPGGTGHSADGACPGPVMKHCATASVDTVKLPAPPGASAGGAGDSWVRAVAGRHAPGSVGRAPPDLSVLSRLLI